MFGSSIGSAPIGSPYRTSGSSNPLYNYVRYSLIDRDSLPQINLAGLEWALFSQLKPSLFTAPIAKGALEDTNSAAQLEIQVLATLVPVGDYCLALTNSTTTLTVLGVVTVVAA